jgi:hypothetical protein
MNNLLRVPAPFNCRVASPNLTLSAILTSFTSRAEAEKLIKLNKQTSKIFFIASPQIILERCRPKRAVSGQGAQQA